MRSYDANSKYDREELEKMKAEPWMVEALSMNPGYVCWGPYEDYMWVDKSPGWNARVINDTWKDFGPWRLDDLNEIVNFYFEIERENEECGACHGSGYNPATEKISNEWYAHTRTDGKRGWNESISQVEVDALWEAHRLRDFKEKPTAEQVNAWSKNGFGHDAINMWICVEARAKSLGVYGKCEICGGSGRLYTEPAAKLGLVLWIIHPRKGCSRGVHIKEIKKDEMPEVVAYLKAAAKRNADRFSGLARKGE